MARDRDAFAAVIDQDLVTDEVRDIALEYDPINRSGGTGFHLTEDGELHIDDANVIAEHRLIQRKIPNDAIRIVRLPAARGELVHRHGKNGFRLYELPAPSSGTVVGLLGRNGLGKSTATAILGGWLRPNLGRVDSPPDWDTVLEQFRGSAVQGHLERLRDGSVQAARKPQRVDRLEGAGPVGAHLAGRDDRDMVERVTDRLALDHLLDRPIEALSGGERQRVAIASTLLADADLYLFDEPYSYLDVGQRLEAAEVIRDLVGDRPTVVVDHDLIALDLVADQIHVLYGEPGGFGVVGRQTTARRGINEYIEGHLRAEDVRIRDRSISFETHVGSPGADGTALSYSDIEVSRDGFDLRVEGAAVDGGQVVAIIGPNGLGKTTFGRTVAGDLEPDRGALETDATVAYKPQRLDPGAGETVGDLLPVDAGEFAIDRLSLEPLLDRRTDHLSGGELQRVAIALALSRGAPVTLLDEPAAYVDVEGRVRLADTLRQFVSRTNGLVFVIEHDLLFVEAVADRVMVFGGDPGRRGVGTAPEPVAAGLDRLLASIGVTFRRDPTTGRPRPNAPGSRLDRAQRDAGTYFEP